MIDLCSVRAVQHWQEHSYAAPYKPSFRRGWKVHNDGTAWVKCIRGGAKTGWGMSALSCRHNMAAKRGGDWVIMMLHPFDKDVSNSKYRLLPLFNALGR